MKIFIENNFINIFVVEDDGAVLYCSKLSDVQAAFRASTNKPMFFWEYLKSWAVTTTRVLKSNKKYGDFAAKWNLQSADFTISDQTDEKAIMEIYKAAVEHEQQSEFQKAAAMLQSSDSAAEYMTIALRQYAIDNNAAISEILRLVQEDPDELLSYIWGTEGYSSNPDDKEDDPDCPPSYPALVPPRS